MRLFRITRSVHAADALAGHGAMLAAGRWHSRGTRIAYTSTHASLALLEVLVNLDRADVPSDYRLLTFEVDGRRLRRLLDLPKGWDRYPHEGRVQRAGDQWIAAGAGLGLRVPSPLTPGEDNVLINPAHASFGEIALVDNRPLPIDDRFLLRG